MFSAKDLFFTGSSGYRISNSLRFRSSASAYLSRTPAGAGTSTKTWTYSAWIKRGTLGGTVDLISARSAANPLFYFQIVSDQINIFARNSGGTTIANYTSAAVFRDPSAWYHIVLKWDALTSTMGLYVNNVLQTLTTATAISNVDYAMNTAIVHEIGRSAYGASDYFDGYMAEIYMIDGQALTPSSFGETDATTGVWKPKAYTGTYGTNGFYLKFADNSGATATTIGKDSSGNGNNWTPNNISVTAGTTYDSMIDTPTPYDNGGNGVGNYCVLNPTDKYSGNVVSDGNLATNGVGVIRSTFGMSSGKWYWEFTPQSTLCLFGIATAAANTAQYVGQNAFGWGYYAATGNKYNNAAPVAYGATFTTNDVIGVAFDADIGTLTFYKNGASQGTAFTGLTSGPYFAASGDNGATAQPTAINFGQRPFTYTPPSGFKALNTQNLPTPTIPAGGNYMAAVLYNGTSASNTVVATSSNSGNNPLALTFQPDLVWIKSRSAATNHELTDAVRGVTKSLVSNSTAAEATDTNGLTAFTSTGFTVGSDSNYNNGTGPATYVAWEWKANGAGSSNTSGSITSTVSANATAGFSVVTFTCPASGNFTVGHGLGVVPNMIIVKSRSTAGNNWCVAHSGMTSMSAYFMQLNTTVAQTNNTSIWANTAPTSSVFSMGTNVACSPSDTAVAYCFAAVAGYSAFGSYTGNGSTDGPFVFTGFRPKFVLVKRTDSTSNWFIHDTARDTYNVSSANLYAELSNAEDTGPAGNMDFLSNGFKSRTGGGSNPNVSGATYIYAAFAETPFSKALAR